MGGHAGVRVAGLLGLGARNAKCGGAVKHPPNSRNKLTTVRQNVHQGVCCVARTVVTLCNCKRQVAEFFKTKILL
jgi:hypothetical protein